MKINWKSGLSLALLFTTNLALADTEKLTINDCHLDGIKQKVQCGQLKVPENYNKPDGQEISINFAVVPAIDNSEDKEPLMFLAGGPGQAAVELAAMLRRQFTEIRKTRDLILVDQRGTGKSHPLQCQNAVEFDAYEAIPEDFSQQDIKTCLAQLTGDLSQYNSENAIRDFDEVRKALGHDKINIYGGSYGTRAGLVYMRMFPDSLRSVVLDSVAPIEVPIGTFGLSADRSFSLLLEHCQEDSACKEAFPNLADEFKTVVTRLETSPVTINMPHPRLGHNIDFVISRSKFISSLRMQLYSVKGRALVPLIINQAFKGNFSPLAGLTATSEGSSPGMYMGLTLNIVCNEDIPKIPSTVVANDANNSFGGGDSHLAWNTACPIWPQYRPNIDFYQPVIAKIPTLLLSGELDPVTPPSNAEYSAKTIPNSKHIVVNNASHTVAMSTCAIDIIEEFLTTLKPKELDESCLKDVPNERFMTSLNGSI